MRSAVLTAAFCVCTFSFAQSTAGGLSFPGGIGPSSPTQFGVQPSTFPNTSGRHDLEDESLQTVPPYSPHYAYPIPRAPLGRDIASRTAVGAPATTVPLHFMLVFRNQTVESAYDCRIDGRVLHYVTISGLARTVPLKQVNWNLTGTTNAIHKDTLLALLKK